MTAPTSTPRGAAAAICTDRTRDDNMALRRDQDSAATTSAAATSIVARAERTRSVPVKNAPTASTTTAEEGSQKSIAVLGATPSSGHRVRARRRVAAATSRALLGCREPTTLPATATATAPAHDRPASGPRAAAGATRRAPWAAASAGRAAVAPAGPSSVFRRTTVTNQIAVYPHVPFGHEDERQLSGHHDGSAALNCHIEKTEGVAMITG